MKKFTETPTREVMALANKGNDSCPGCAATVGQYHSRHCPVALCWKCHEVRAKCGCDTFVKEPFLFTGPLERVFAERNRYHAGMFLDEFDHMPGYKSGRLTSLRTNNVDPDAWGMIENHAPGLIDLTVSMPHLNNQNLDNSSCSIFNSPWKDRLQILQMGEGARDWNAGVNEDYDCPCESEDSSTLVRLIESMPAVVELYLFVWLPDIAPVLKAAYSSTLRALIISTTRDIDLDLVAQNTTLEHVSVLGIRKSVKEDPVDAEAFRKKFNALLNSPHLGHVEHLAIELPEVDDECSKMVVGSPLFRHLRGLRLAGKNLSDASAGTFAASDEAKRLEVLDLDGMALSTNGRDALRAAGVRLFGSGAAG